MKKNLLLCLLILVLNISAKAEFGAYASAVYINTNGSSQFYNTQLKNDPNSIGTVNFEGSLGSFVANTGTLSIRGGELKTFRDNNGNVCSGMLYYTVYPQGARPASPAFNAINLAFFCDCSGGTFNSCGGGLCTDGRDQKWQSIDQTNDMTQHEPGNYTIEIFYKMTGNPTTNTCSEDRYDSNLGANYTANFTITTNLAVNFSGLTTSFADNAVKLKWSIENDVDINRYEIQRSADGINFTAVNVIASVRSVLKYTYSLMDISPIVGNSYYRIKFYKTDNSISYSKICRVDISNTGNNISVLLNRSAGGVSIRLTAIPKGKYEMAIINDIGQQLVNYSLQHDGIDNTLPINITGKLSTGLYRLVLKNATEHYAASFLVK